MKYVAIFNINFNCQGRIKLKQYEQPLKHIIYSQLILTYLKISCITWLQENVCKFHDAFVTLRLSSSKSHITLQSCSKTNKQTNKQKTRFRIQWHIQRVLNTGILVWAPTLSAQINEKQL